MKLDTALKLGRVSNLPTVWSNVLAGCVISGGDPSFASMGALGLAASLMYVGGMYLNDAYDAEIDAKERPERPIPAGEVSVSTVMAAGFGMLGLGVAIVSAVAVLGAGSWLGVLAAFTTAGLIVLYNRWHKGNPLGPAIMGACRMGVYAFAGYSTAAVVDTDLFAAAGLILAYVLGLTYVAKHENTSTLGRSWPRALLYLPLVYSLPLLRGPLLVRMLFGCFGMWVARSIDFAKRKQPKHTKTAIVSLIAGISLLDGLVIARAGRVDLVLAAAAAFLLTLALQRKVAGT